MTRDRLSGCNWPDLSTMPPFPNHYCTKSKWRRQCQRYFGVNFSSVQCEDTETHHPSSFTVYRPVQDWRLQYSPAQTDTTVSPSRELRVNIAVAFHLWGPLLARGMRFVSFCKYRAGDAKDGEVAIAKDPFRMNHRLIWHFTKTSSTLKHLQQRRPLQTGWSEMVPFKNHSNSSCWSHNAIHWMGRVTHQLMNAQSHSNDELFSLSVSALLSWFGILTDTILTLKCTLLEPQNIAKHWASCQMAKLFFFSSPYCFYVPSLPTLTPSANARPLENRKTA